MEYVLPLAIITTLILLNGLFVAAEFALVMAPRAAIERLADEGNRAAGTLRRILSEARLQDRCIATAQLGITVASLGLGMYGEHVLAVWIGHGLDAVGMPGWLAAHALASVLSIVLLTYLHIVLGEMVPKSLALQQPQSAALWLIRPVQWTQYAAFPLVIFLAGLGNGVLRLLGIRRQAVGHERYYSAEELQYVIRESQRGGLLRAESGRVLSDLLEFGDIAASEVMVPRTKAIGIPAGAGTDEIKRIIRRSRHTRYPVFEKDLDHILGVVHLKDLFRILIHGRSLSSDVVRPVPRVPEPLTLDRVLEAMRAARAQMVVVMDEHGGTAGILTMEDLFEEIVGDIEEPGGLEGRPEIYRDEQGVLHAAGPVRLPEVGEHLGIELEHDEVDSVSGLVLLLLGRPARPGDAVEFDHVQFEVTAVAGHGVAECRVIPLPTAGEDNNGP
ncbi:MAG: hemolysin family protein [Planctomycetes bacterium]|nr:hemolysin family protein [Planctomycetota bacterium]